MFMYYYTAHPVETKLVSSELISIRFMFVLLVISIYGHIYIL